MCGIFGVMGNFSRDEMGLRLDEMAKILKHRGPDDVGFHLQPDKGVGIGMTRLSIVDRMGGHQPIYNEDKSLVLVFNGEIYNYRELREELQAKGHTFRTQTDTETIIHLYEEEGVDCATRLNGMFAFAILNLKNGELYLARDRFGIKQLIYSFHRGFIFASEMKAFLVFPNFPMEIDQQALSDHLSLWYIPSPRCALRSASKLQQGHWMKVKSPTDIEIQRYWTPHYSEEPVQSEAELKEEYFSRLETAVSRQLQGEVPIGLFLSGGLDSGSIAAILAARRDISFHTFSVGFDHKSYDETPLINETAKKFSRQHHHITVTGNILDLIEEVTFSQDQPLGLTSYHYYQLCREAKQYATVILTGEGGDEILGGYDTYCGHPYLQLYRFLPQAVRSGIREKILPLIPHSFSKRGIDIQLRKFAEAAEFTPERAHVSWREIFLPHEKKLLINHDAGIDLDPYHAFADFIEDNSISQLINRFMYSDLAVFLPEVGLAQSDRMGMAHSLEIRVPFLDNDFFDFTARLPLKWKIRRLTPKYMVRKFLGETLPKNVLKAPKYGMTPPIAQWFFGPLRDYMHDLLQQKNIREWGGINTDYAQEVFNEHLSRKKDHSRRLMVLFGYLNWYNIFFLNGKNRVRQTLEKTN